MIEVLKQMVEALECALSEDKPYIDKCKQAIKAGKQAIAELESQEPVAWMFEDDEDNGHKIFRQTQPSPEAVAYLAKWNRPAWVPLYTSPPASKPWVGLTDEEILQTLDLVAYDTQAFDFAYRIETKLREKNT